MQKSILEHPASEGCREAENAGGVSPIAVNSLVTTS